MKLEQYIKLILVGMMGGLISSLFGVGGGIIFVPAFNSILGLDMKKSIGTSLTCIVPISIISAYAHYIRLHEHFPWQETTFLAIAAVLAAQIGVYLVHKLRSTALMYIFSIYLILTCFKILFFPAIEHSPQQHFLPSTSIMVAIGSVTGLLSSLLGIGGGVVIVSSLNGFFGTDMILSVTLSLLVIVPTTLSGFLGHLRRDNIEWKFIAPIVIPALFFAYLGVGLSYKLGSDTLKYLFCSFAIFISIRLILKARSGHGKHA
ncbi:MAG: sulfite exporter TauE/SafE family protein [Leptospiraceae bacterium]|nr:sulfite exporter TauE/SafE family protein [Leptospiraceae bacterium]MCP5501271.1 sulfite exporter TauE/SafE family protein [Leptospiraceae bacterium]